MGPAPGGLSFFQARSIASGDSRTYKQSVRNEAPHTAGPWASTGKTFRFVVGGRCLVFPFPGFGRGVLFRGRGAPGAGLNSGLPIENPLNKDRARIVIFESLSKRNFPEPCTDFDRRFPPKLPKGLDASQQSTNETTSCFIHISFNFQTSFR